MKYFYISFIGIAFFSSLLGVFGEKIEIEGKTDYLISFLWNAYKNPELSFSETTIVSYNHANKEIAILGAVKSLKEKDIACLTSFISSSNYRYIPTSKTSTLPIIILGIRSQETIRFVLNSLRSDGMFARNIPEAGS